MKALLKKAVRAATIGRNGPILINSIPKSGTHLMRSMVLTLPGVRPTHDLAALAMQESAASQRDLLQDKLYDLRDHLAYTAHLPYSDPTATYLAECNVRHIFVYRDPRDVAVSLMHFIMKQESNLFTTFSALPDDAARLLAVIEGVGAGRQTYTYGTDDALPSLRLMFDAFYGWMAQPSVFAVRYADLIAADGQPAEGIEDVLTRLVTFLGFSAENHTITNLIEIGMQPNRAKTFRRGVSGGWRSAFGAEHLAAWEKISAELAWATQ